MDDLPSDEYFCHCKGCFNGYGSSFYAAPAFWFQERGFSLPKNCPDCREWIKSQYDEEVDCKDCGFKMRLSARYKISHHKRTGPWQAPTQCRRCEQGRKMKPGVEKRNERSWIPELTKEEDDEFDRIADGIQVEARLIDTNPQNYQRVINRQGESRQMHIERHVTGAANSLVGLVSHRVVLPDLEVALTGCSLMLADYLPKPILPMYVSICKQAVDRGLFVRHY